MRVVCLYFLPQFDPKTMSLEVIAEACLRFSPKLAVLKTENVNAIFIEISKCKTLYTEAGLNLRLQVLLKKWNLLHFTRVTFADDLASALTFAKYQKNTSDDLPITALSHYPNPFFPHTLERIFPILHQLGITTLGELRALPQGSLPARFGKSLYHALHPAPFTEWPLFHPPETTLESIDIDDMDTIETLEPILFILKMLLDRLMTRLHGRSLKIAALTVRLSQAKYSHIKESVREYKVELAFAQNSTLRLLAILRDRLDHQIRQDPLESPLNRVEIEVTQTVQNQGRQLQFFSKQQEEQENLESALARLSNKLGFERVFFASLRESYLPEKSWQKTMSLEGKIEERSPLIPHRPLRVLTRPIPVRRFDQYLILNRKRFKIKSIEGPERVTGEWWMDTGETQSERDYFRFKIETGEDLWVYEHRLTHHYFIHGMFD